MGIVREGCDLSVDCRYLLLLLENDLQRSQMFFRLVALMHTCKHNLLSRETYLFQFFICLQVAISIGHSSIALGCGLLGSRAHPCLIHYCTYLALTYLSAIRYHETLLTIVPNINFLAGTA
jgi:hypothetical protein